MLLSKEFIVLFAILGTSWACLGFWQERCQAFEDRNGYRPLLCLHCPRRPQSKPKEASPPSGGTIWMVPYYPQPQGNMQPPQWNLPPPQWYPQSQPQWYPQPPPQWNMQSQPPQWNTQLQPQWNPQSQPQPQWNPQSQPQGNPQSWQQWYPQSQPQGNPQSQPQGNPQSRPQVNMQPPSQWNNQQPQGFVPQGNSAYTEFPHEDVTEKYENWPKIDIRSAF